MIGFIGFGREVGKNWGRERSPKWRKVSKQAQKDCPYCRACDAKNNLQTHHIVPFHINPDLELDPSNLIVLCGRCHLLIGHLGYWKSWNVDVWRMVVNLYSKIKNRPVRKI